MPPRKKPEADAGVEPAPPDGLSGSDPDATTLTSGAEQAPSQPSKEERERKVLDALRRLHERPSASAPLNA